MIFPEPTIDFLQVIRQHFWVTLFGSMDVIYCGMPFDVDKVAILKNIQGDVTIETIFFEYISRLYILLNIYLG